MENKQTVREAFKSILRRRFDAAHDDMEVNMRKDFTDDAVEDVMHAFDTALTTIIERIVAGLPHGSEVNYEEDNEAAGRRNAKDEDCQIIREALGKV